jgi:hypothetical protein
MLGACPADGGPHQGLGIIIIAFGVLSFMVIYTPIFLPSFSTSCYFPLELGQGLLSEILSLERCGLSAFWWVLVELLLSLLFSFLSIDR